MSVVVIGLDHRSAPLDVLEKVAIAPDELPHAFDLLAKSEHVTEAVVLSTCMRTEIYVHALRFHGAVGDVRRVLSLLSGVRMEDFSSHLYEYFDESAVEHLFRVAAGLESPVVGESEVLGQVSRAWSRAAELDAARSVLGDLFRSAIGAGRRARAETNIGRGATSIGQAAVVMAADYLGGLGDTRSLVVGAGDMAESMALTIARDKSAEIVVCNRTEDRGEQLAARVGGTFLPLDSLTAALVDADVVLSSTGSPVIDLPAVEVAMSQRPNRSLVLVDMGVPHDIDPAAASVEGVKLFDLQSLRDFAKSRVRERLSEVQAVEAILAEELVAYERQAAARLVAPMVRDMRDRVEEVRRAELDRQRVKLASLTSDQLEAVDQATRAVLAKVLHEPTVRLKDSAGTPEGVRIAEAVRLLLDL